MIIKRSFKALLGVLTMVLTLGMTSVAFAQVPTETRWGMPKDVSLDGHRIDWLINITNVFITILFVIMVIWMVWAVLAHNEKHEAEYDHGDSRHHTMVAMAISALIFIVVDGNLFYHSTIDMLTVFWNYEKVENTEGHVKIQVMGRQWIWQGRYAGPDGEFATADDAITTNDFRVPVDTPVLMQIGSPDVIHNFYLPNFRVKVDAMPGSINQLWFQATETGQFEIGCAQHCGAAHYKMRAILTVLSREDYEQWVREQSRDAQQIYDPEGGDANWGWAWKKI